MFVDARGKSDFVGRYSTTVKLRAKFNARWKYLRELNREHWQRPEAAKLSKVGKGEYKDYYEIRFQVHREVWRPIGYFGPGDNDFTILVLVREKGDRFEPKEWRSKADSARDKIDKFGEDYVNDFTKAN